MQGNPRTRQKTDQKVEQAEKPEITRYALIRQKLSEKEKLHILIYLLNPYKYFENQILYFLSKNLFLDSSKIERQKNVVKIERQPKISVRSPQYPNFRPKNPLQPKKSLSFMTRTIHYRTQESVSKSEFTLLRKSVSKINSKISWELEGLKLWRNHELTEKNKSGVSPRSRMRKKQSSF